MLTSIVKTQLNLNQIITSSLFPTSPIPFIISMAVCMPFIDELAYMNVHFGTEFTSRRI